MPVTQYPNKKVLGISGIIDAIIELIQRNMIARTSLTVNAAIGATTLSINNAFQFRPDDEIILIDNGYADPESNHYNIFEYARIKKINSTSSITLHSPLQGDWLLSASSAIQKTIGHSPLYADNVYYGDRAIIPIDQMAITVEPVSMSNEWMYIQGGLGQEYKVEITVYGKTVEMDTGKRIVDLYADNITRLMNENIHLDVDGYSTYLLSDVLAGESVVIIEDTPENRETFDPDNITQNGGFLVQDNKSSTCFTNIDSISYGGGLIQVQMAAPLGDDFLLSECAMLKKIGRYVWDSRASGVTYGTIQKQSGLLRAAKIDWFCKIVDDYSFPQVSKKVQECIPLSPDDSSSSSSLDSTSSSSSSSSG